MPLFGALSHPMPLSMHALLLSATRGQCPCIYVERVAHTHHCLCPVHGDGPGWAGLWVRPVQYGLETRARMASIWSCPVPTYFAYQAMWPCTRGAFIRCLYLVPLFGAYAGVACAAGGGEAVGAHRCRSRAAAGPKPVLPRAGPGCTPPGRPPVALKLCITSKKFGAVLHCPKYYCIVCQAR